MGRLVPAISRAIDVLELVRQSDKPLSVPEIAVQLGLPRSTTHEIVNTLVARDCLVPGSVGSNRYVLGPLLFDFGNAYAATVDLIREAQGAVDEVAQICNETVQVATLSGTDIYYIAKDDSSRAVRLVYDLNKRLPAHATALGKVLLAGLSDEEVVWRYGGSTTLQAQTRNTITTVEGLLIELEAVRRAGVAFDDCEMDDGVQCIAAAIHSATGTVVAALSISIPVIRMTRPRRVELERLALTGAVKLSRRLGYHPPGSRVAHQTDRVVAGGTATTE